MTGHPTPTGIFSILEKNRYHYSNLYGGAPMPFMQRVTNSGVAMHAGDLPGYPASHGCIRLPYSFARSLFGITDVGARVIITDEDLTPAEFNSPRLIAPLPPDTAASEPIGFRRPTFSRRARLQLRATHRARAARRPRLASPSAAGSCRQSPKPRTPGRPHRTKPSLPRRRCKKPRKPSARSATRRAASPSSRARPPRPPTAAAGRFTELTAKMAKIDTSTLAAADLEKQSADEVAEETKMLDAADAAVAAKRTANAQAAKAKQAVADAGALDKARKVATDDVKQRRDGGGERQGHARCRRRPRGAQGLPGLRVHQRQDRTPRRQARLRAGDRRAGDHRRARQAARHARPHRDHLHRRREGAALERRDAEADRVRAVRAPQEAPPRGRGARRCRRPRCRRRDRARAHRDPQGDGRSSSPS